MSRKFNRTECLKNEFSLSSLSLCLYTGYSVKLKPIYNIHIYKIFIRLDLDSKCQRNPNNEFSNIFLSFNKPQDDIYIEAECRVPLTGARHFHQGRSIVHCLTENAMGMGLGMVYLYQYLTYKSASRCIPLTAG